MGKNVTKINIIIMICIILLLYIVVFTRRMILTPLSTLKTMSISSVLACYFLSYLIPWLVDLAGKGFNLEVMLHLSLPISWRVRIPCMVCRVRSLGEVEGGGG